MDALLALIFALAVMLILVALEVPISFALLASGAVGITSINGWGYAAASLASTPYEVVASYTLVLLPMFIAMGMFVLKAGIADDLYNGANRFLQKYPSGLGLSAVAACAGFAAVSGSSAATVSTIGRVAFPQMAKQGYSKAFSAGLVGSAGTLGALIPPSILLVLYAVTAGESVGDMLLAGLIPGLISASLYVVFVPMFRRMRWAQAEPGEWSSSDGDQQTEDVSSPILPVDDSQSIQILAEDSRGAQTLAEDRGTVRTLTEDSNGVPALTEDLGDVRKLRRYKGPIALVQVVLVGGTVFVGIYSGLVTPTEAGILGAIVAMLVCVFNLIARKQRVLPPLLESLRETGNMSGMLFLLIVGGFLFGTFTVVSRVPQELSGVIVAAELNPYLVVILLLVLMIPLGMVLDGMTMVLILVPLTYPVVTDLGFDGIWYGILLVKMVELSLITPPIGINAFVVASIRRDIPLEKIFSGLLRFAVVDVVAIVIIFLIPETATWLPSTAN